MKPGKLIGIGIGPGDPELLTIKAAKILKSCGCVFTVISQHVDTSVSETVVRSVAPGARIIRLTFSMSRDRKEREDQVLRNAERIRDELVKGQDCAYTTLGDTLTYSTYGYMVALLKKILPGFAYETVPGITSYSTLAARSGSVLVENTQNLRVVPAFKASMADSIEFPEDTSTVLLKTYRSRNALIERLRKERNVDVVYGENLTMAGEFISRDLDEIASRPDAYFSLMIVRARSGSRD